MPSNVQILNKESQNDGLDFVGVLRDCLTCAVIVIDERRQVSAFNTTAERLTKLAQSQVIGKTFQTLPAPLPDFIQKTFSGERVSEKRFTFHHAKPGEIDLELNLTPIPGPGDEVIGAVIVLNDISTIEKWEINMRRLDRLHSIGTLSAGMAHEVKNALVAVKTFVDLLLEKNQEAELAEIVRREMTRIESIVGQMLKFSRSSEPTYSEMHLHFVLTKSLRLMQHLLEEKKIKLTRTFAAAPDLMLGDQDQLEQAFLNLFFNALDAMDVNGRLVVTTEVLPPNTVIKDLSTDPAQRWLRLIIHDSGMGIPSENLARLYEPFFTTKPEGTGLGLPITRRIIQEHKGAISVHSEPGQGTAFTIILPLRAKS